MQPVFDRIKERVPVLMTQSLREVVRFRPRILVVADSRYYLYRHRLPETIVVWIRHGLADKNFAGPCVRGADFACLSSEWFARDYRRRRYLPRMGFWITGYVSMDPVFDPAKRREPEALKQLVRGPGRKTLLYAPTWNRWMGSAEMVTPAWLETLLERFPGLNLVVRPHPGIRDHMPAVPAGWRRVCRRHPDRAVMLEDPAQSIYELFPTADIMLSDASSVFLYYLALDRPLVLLNPPRRFREKSYCNVQGPEWVWRDCAHQVTDLAGLVTAVAAALDDPARLSPQRRKYRERIFGELRDGRAAERTADRLIELSAGADSPHAWVRSAWADMKTWRPVNRATGFKSRFVHVFTPLGYRLERYPALKYRLNQIRRAWIKEI